MVLDKQKFLERVQNYIGENTDDDAISFLEDVNDSVEAFTANEGLDWKAKYEQNDAEWRARYINRFKNPSDNSDDIGDDNNDPPPKQYTFDSLFTAN